jgi:hypothetical protein
MRLNLVALGHVLESQGTGAYFRVTKSRGRGALRRERDCVSTDGGGEGAGEAARQLLSADAGRDRLSQSR